MSSLQCDPYLWIDAGLWDFRTDLHDPVYFCGTEQCHQQRRRSSDGGTDFVWQHALWDDSVWWHFGEWYGVRRQYRRNGFYEPAGSDGIIPTAGLVLSGSTLYGTAAGGGSFDNGTVFAINTDGSGFTNLYSFAAGDAVGPASAYTYTNSDGTHPNARLLLSGNTLYGTATYGGTPGNGTVFSLSFAPQLTITPSAANVILSWPTNYAGFDFSGYTLQSAKNLASPVWTTNLPAPTVVNGQYTVTIWILGTQQFFRLSQ